MYLLLLIIDFFSHFYEANQSKFDQSLAFFLSLSEFVTVLWKKRETGCTVMRKFPEYNFLFFSKISHFFHFSLSRKWQMTFFQPFLFQINNLFLSLKIFWSKISVRDVVFFAILAVRANPSSNFHFSLRSLQTIGTSVLDWCKPENTPFCRRKFILSVAGDSCFRLHCSVVGPNSAQDSTVLIHFCSQSPTN